MRFKKNSHWLLLGILPIGLVTTCVFSQNNQPFLQIALLAQLVALYLHQWEEFAFPGGFELFYNIEIYQHSKITRFQLTPTGVYIVNMFLGWGAYSFAIILNTAALGMGLALVHLANGLSHIILALVKRRYNAGCVSSLLFLLPSALWVLVLGSPKTELSEWLLIFLIVPVAISLIQLSLWLGSKCDNKG